MSTWNTQCRRCGGRAILRRKVCAPCSRSIDLIIRRAADGWVEPEELAAMLGISRAEIYTRRYRMKRRALSGRNPLRVAR